MKTVYALLIAIDDYAKPVPKLDGCVNDLNAIKEYMEVHFRSEKVAFEFEILTDKEATRENIIKGFDHFSTAKNGDTCLLYYCGHGAHSDAPEAFWHIEPSKKIESLVCWDSRNEGGRDLMDKELSYLIWKTTKDKDLHFLAIMDCCHSGSNTRSNVKIRKADAINKMVEVEAYLGFEHYTKVGEKSYIAPRGKHVQLAAANATETAKEVYLGGKSRGVFTYCLIEALKNSNNKISYAELINRVNIRLKNIVDKQSAQIGLTDTYDGSLTFLSGIIEPEETTYLVGYNKKNGWTMNAGALHGIPKGNEKTKNLLELVDNKREVETKNVFAGYAEIKGMGGHDTKKSFKAKMLKRAASQIQIAFAKDAASDGKALLKEAFESESFDDFTLTEDDTATQYIIHVKENAYFLTKAFDERVLFKRIENYTKDSAVLFLNGLKKLSDWKRTLELTNPKSSIQEEEIQIELYKMTTPGEYENQGAKRLLDWKVANNFRYLRGDDEWHKPAFQLKIKNTGQRNLWFSLLYLGDDFSISNQLLQKQQLAPGEEVWATDIDDGIAYRGIPIEVADEYLSWDVNCIENFLKVMICTTEFNTEGFNQKGLELEARTNRTIASRRGRPQLHDWETKDIQIGIRRHKEA